MFDNIGGKIKISAAIVAAVGTIVSCIVMMILISANDEMLAAIGIGVFIVGSLASWVSSFVLYGFGQLVENSDILAGRITLEEATQTKNENAVYFPKSSREFGEEIDVEKADVEEMYIGSENPEVAEKLEELEMRYAKGQIDRTAYMEERELILKQSRWFAE